MPVSNVIAGGFAAGGNHCVRRRPVFAGGRRPSSFRYVVNKILLQTND